ncbi:GerAB/ArcD/ProY family transporter [Paenibacillus sp. UNC451MF]|uniref:GerAB/ArcD/ProY family transporter n=1 Tax=Paenibacillus sp. UNC451MF TaxID=1449063 RepID=UPI00048EAB67|nr:endospore germination permease [Paenibacillus sp. UNC451MF]
MKHQAVNKMTTIQYIFLTTGIQISVAFLALPRILAERAGTDGWVSLVIGWAISVASSWALIMVMKRSSNQETLLGLLNRYIGKWAMWVFGAPFALYFIYFGYAGLVRAIIITKTWVLPQTPSYIIMILFLIPTYIIASNGAMILGRYAELIFLMSLWVPFVYLIPFKDARWLHLLPIWKTGWSPIFSALPDSIYAYAGFGASFILYPFLEHKEKAAFGLIISNSLTLLGYLFITVACFVYFSPKEIQEYNEPVITLLKALEFKFVERVEILFISFFLLIFSLSWIPTFYVGVYCTSRLLGSQDSRNHLRILLVALAVASYFFMPSSRLSERLDSIVGSIGFLQEYVFPFLLLAYIWIYDRFQRRSSA